MNSLVTKCLSFGLVVIVLLSAIAEAHDMNAPPTRPDIFTNPQELRDYLKALNEYFAIVGRPRFGRSVSKRSFGYNKRRLDSFSGYDRDRDGVVSPADIAYYSNYVLGVKRK